MAGSVTAESLRAAEPGRYVDKLLFLLALPRGIEPLFPP